MSKKSVSYLLASSLLFTALSIQAYANDKSVALTKKAQEAMEKGDANTAIIHLKNALKEDDSDVAARVKLGDLYFAKGQLADAEKEYEFALSKGADDKTFILALAEAYQREGKFDEVIDKIQPGNRGDDIESRIIGARGFAFLGKGDIEQAKKLIGEAVAKNPKNPDIRLWEVNLYVQLKDLKQAENVLDEILKESPDFVPALVLKGNFLKSNQKLDEAVDLYTKALDKDPKEFQARYNRGLSYFALNKDAEAEKDAAVLTDIAPKHPLVNYLNALLLAKKNQDDQATEKLQTMGAFVNEYPPALYLMGMLNFRNQRLEAAEANFRMLLGFAPQSADVRIFLANIYMAKGTPQKAIDLLNEIVTDSTTDQRLLGTLSNAYMKAGKADKATEILEKVISIAPDNEEAQTRLALTRLQGGNATEGLAELEKLNEKNPDNVQSGLLLAISYIQANRLEEAEKEILEIKDKMKDNPFPENLLGAVYARMNQPDKAREAFNKAIAIKSDFAPAYFNLAGMAIVEKKFDEAQKLYESVLKFDDKNIKAYTGLATLANQAGKKDDVLKYLKMASDKNPKDPQPAIAVVDFYLGNQDTDTALMTARKLSETYPDDVYVLDVLGRTQLLAKQYDGAISTYQKLVSVNPELPMGYYRLAQSYASVKKMDEAKKTLLQAVKSNPTFILGYRDLIALAVQEKNYTEALTYAEDLKKNDPKSSLGDMVIGDIYREQGDIEKAMHAYKAGFDFQPNNMLLVKLYETNVMQKKEKEGRELLENWLEKNPDDAGVLTVYANHLLQVNEKDKAIAQYEHVLKLNPKNPMALNNLAWLYHEKSDPKAIETAKQAYDLAPAVPEVADTYGWILFKSGDKKQARTVFSKSLENAETKNPTIQYHYAFVLSEDGDKKEAVKILQALLKDNPNFPEKPDAEKLLKDLS